MFPPQVIKKLKGDAPDGTHLARYDVAYNLPAPRVLHVRCPDCCAAPDHPCVSTKN